MYEIHLCQLAALEKCLDVHIVLVGNLQKNKERIQKFKEIRDSQYIYQIELDKACFQYDIAYGHFKGLTGRSEKKLLKKYYMIKHLILLKIRNMMDIKVDLLQWSINSLRKKLLLRMHDQTPYP